MIGKRTGDVAGAIAATSKIRAKTLKQPQSKLTEIEVGWVKNPQFLQPILG